MNRLRTPLFIISFIFILIFTSNYTFAQSRMKQGFRDMSQRHFLTYWLVYPESKDSLELHIYTKISHELLQFVQDDSVYSSKYEITVQVINDKKQAVDGTIIRREVTVNDFSETTQMTAYEKDMFSFLLTPGDYSIFIELNDLETAEPVRREQDISIKPPFEEPLEISTFHYFNEMEPIESSFKHIPPEFPAVRTPDATTFRAGFILASQNFNSPAALQYQIFNSQGIMILSDSTRIHRSSSLQPFIIELNQPLKFGKYDMIIRVRDLEVQIEKATAFFVQWEKHPLTLTDLNQAILAMRYIMDGREYKTLKDLPEDEQKEKFEAYWAERDPTPDTEENELEEEYFRRVSVVNHQFASWQEGGQGWKTDRGRVYIIYGPPTDIERPTTNMASQVQYEVWYYRDTHKRFVFMDRFGTNEFRLISETH